MKKSILMILVSLVLALPCHAGSKVPANWKSWNPYPEVSRISAFMVANLLMKGEKMIFVYAGYEKDHHRYTRVVAAFAGMTCLAAFFEPVSL